VRNAEQSRDAIMKDPELEGPLRSRALKAVTSYYSLVIGVVSLNC